MPDTSPTPPAAPDVEATASALLEEAAVLLADEVPAADDVLAEEAELLEDDLLLVEVDVLLPHPANSPAAIAAVSTTLTTCFFIVKPS